MDLVHPARSEQCSCPSLKLRSCSRGRRATEYDIAAVVSMRCRVELQRWVSFYTREEYCTTDKYNGYLTLLPDA